MDQITLNTQKISFYAEIQQKICDLKSNSPDDDINRIIDEIPENMINQKEDIMIICQIFSYYARIREISKKKNAIKLFERIMPRIKEHLQDESSFFWVIFGSHFYFKLWFYEEGLISIEQIILAAQEDKSSYVTEYFLPEIIKEKSEIFDKELKYKYKKSFSSEAIQNYIELRKKHFKWIRESSDYHDPTYQEIEKNRLRLSIKRDDIDTFQKILSESNLSIDSMIMESALENVQIVPTEMTLIEYAVEFNSTKIIKFLIMNDAKIEIDLLYFSIQRNIYDMIHILESRFKKDFEKESLPNSIILWNDEMIDYSVNNFDFNMLFEKDIKKENDMALRCVNQTFKSFNFMFLKSTILPFLNNNPEFVEHNIYEIIMSTFGEKSCFFFKQFMKFPGIDINHHCTKYNITFLFTAIEEANIKSVEILLNDPKINVNCPCYDKLSPIQVASKVFADMKIIKMLCNHPNIDLEKKDSAFHSNAFELSVCCGHFYAAQFIIDNFYDLDKKNDFYLLFFLCLCYHHLYSLKIIMKYFFDKNPFLNGPKIIDVFKKLFRNQADYRDEFEADLKQICLELDISI